MNVLVIAGSLRTDSSNVALVRVIAELAPTDVTVTAFDALSELPLFSPDIDTEEPPQVIAKFRAQVNIAEAVLICTPEYAYGMPGSLKNALDWLVSSARQSEWKNGVANNNTLLAHTVRTKSEILTAENLLKINRKSI